MLKKSVILAALTVALVCANSALAQTSLALKSLDGATVDVQAQKNKVVVLAVGASWLPLSKDQAVITNKLARKYAGSQVAIYWISNDSDNAKSKNFATDEQIKAFADKNKLTVTVLRDPTGQAVKRFGIDQIPAFIVLDKTGKASGTAIGGVDPENDITPDIAAKIDSLLR
jgi:thiol-disulfide isomerase/thioredoxin